MNDWFSLSPVSVDHFQRMLKVEEYNELSFYSYLQQITNTDFAEALGIPPLFLSGSYRKDGEPILIRAQDIINIGAWNRHLKKPRRFQLPSGFTIVSFALTFMTTDFARYYLEYASRPTKKKYGGLSGIGEPKDPVWCFWNTVRAGCIWQSIAEKMALEREGLHGFASRWVYEHLVEGRAIHSEYGRSIRKVFKAVRHYKYILDEDAYDDMLRARKKKNYDAFKQQISPLVSLPQPPRPLLRENEPVLRLTERPPTNLFAIAEVS